MVCIRRGAALDIKTSPAGRRGFCIPPEKWLLKLISFPQEEELKKHIYETESVMKTSCDIYKEKGDYYFQNEYSLFLFYAYIIPIPAGTTRAGVNPCMAKKLG